MCEWSVVLRSASIVCCCTGLTWLCSLHARHVLRSPTGGATRPSIGARCCFALACLECAATRSSAHGSGARRAVGRFADEKRQQDDGLEGQSTTHLRPRLLPLVFRPTSCSEPGQRSVGCDWQCSKAQRSVALRMSPGVMRVAVLGSAEEASEATDGLADFLARVQSEKREAWG